MTVVRVNDEHGVSYFDVADGSHLETRKTEVENFEALPPKVQKAWVDTWAEEASRDPVVGIAGLQAITVFLRQNKKRTATSEAARRQLVLDLLSVSLEEATNSTLSVGEGGTQVDLLTAVRDTLGIPYPTLATWAADVPDKAVLKELDNRAKASPKPGRSAAP